jgi:hypothetical protein
MKSLFPLLDKLYKHFRRILEICGKHYKGAVPRRMPKAVEGRPEWPIVSGVQYDFDLLVFGGYFSQQLRRSVRGCIVTENMLAFVIAQFILKQQFYRFIAVINV